MFAHLLVLELFFRRTLCLKNSNVFCNLFAVLFMQCLKNYSVDSFSSFVNVSCHFIYFIADFSKYMFLFIFLPTRTYNSAIKFFNPFLMPTIIHLYYFQWKLLIHRYIRCTYICKSIIIYHLHIPSHFLFFKISFYIFDTIIYKYS